MMKNKISIILVILTGFVLMSGVVDLNNLFNYESQDKPTYIIKDNTPPANQLSDAGATLGRVLFYDKKLSINDQISCSSCHLQEFAFGDTALVSSGVNGVTGRHSMRLVNARFSNEVKAFWDERATSYEDQATKPIQDHVEMGFSGENGDPGFDDLVVKLEKIDYYNVLFKFVFGDTEITEERVQMALAQFVRSIYSFDSKFDEGRAMVNNDEAEFPNFTLEENVGKDLFFIHPPRGGAGCARCHSGAEFSIIPDIDNNGVIGVANNPGSIDLTNTKAPSLRDLVNHNGVENGPFMHDGSLKTLMDVVEHYNDLTEVTENTNLDFRLAGLMHNLELAPEEKEALVAFLRTLSGKEVYTAEKWSDPFDDQGNITVVPLEPSATSDFNNPFNVKFYPNPTIDQINITLDKGEYQLFIFDIKGTKIKSSLINENHIEDLSNLENGTYMMKIVDIASKKAYSGKVEKN